MAEPEKREGGPSYTPASPAKRALAWTGVAYMVILVALTTYYYFNGVMLGNLAPLLCVPGLVGLGFVALLSRAGRRGLVALALLCWLLALLALPVGIVGLLSNFGG